MGIVCSAELKLLEIKLIFLEPVTSNPLTPDKLKLLLLEILPEKILNG